jgi:hypothetical protein
MLGCGSCTASQIHTAQVARKLALTAAATKKGTNKRKQAAAAPTAAVLESPLNGATAVAAGKRKAGSAAQEDFQLPGLGADGKLTAAVGFGALRIISLSPRARAVWDIWGMAEHLRHFGA